MSVRSVLPVAVGVAMPTYTGYTEPPLRRIAMTYDEHLALPERPRAAWVDGVVVVSPDPRPSHQLAASRLERPLTESLPGLIVIRRTTVRLPGNRERGPYGVVEARLAEVLGPRRT